MNPLIKFLASYKEAVMGLKAADLYLRPVISGREVVLTYKDNRLTDTIVDGDTLRRSRVPLTLLTNFKPKALSVHQYVNVHCTLTKYDNRTWLIARFISIGKHCVPLGMSMPLQLSLLRDRRFITDMKLCSWASVTGVSPKGTAETEELSRSFSYVNSFYQDRLQSVRQVLEGETTAYWSDDPGIGQRILPIDRVRGLQIAGTVMRSKV